MRIKVRDSFGYILILVALVLFAATWDRAERNPIFPIPATVPDQKPYVDWRISDKHIHVGMHIGEVTGEGNTIGIKGMPDSMSIDQRNGHGTYSWGSSQDGGCDPLFPGLLIVETNSMGFIIRIDVMPCKNWAS